LLPGVTDDDSPPEFPAGAVSAAWAIDGIADNVLLVSPDELLSVQPATRIPATSIDDAISIMILLFCIGYISWNVRSMHRVQCIEYARDRDFLF
jgi:hypothetical protein